MMNYTNPKFVIISLLMIFLSCINIQGQVQEAFQTRFNETVQGDITLIANNVISRTATGDYNGSDGNHDFSNNVYVDIDNDPTTFNSSSANFSNPRPELVCLSVKRAFIYWAAADKEPDDDDLNSDNQPDWDFNQVKLKLPGQTNYSTITADDVIYRGRDTHFSNDPYICVKDISAEVLALGSAFGTYQVANVEAKTGSLVSHDDTNTGTSGGWQIAFVYESPKLPSKNVSLFDGYAHVTLNDNDFDISFNGFQTVPTGNVNANLVVGALEGDRDLGGDILKIQNTANNFVPISSPTRSANNFFNSRITTNGANFIDRTPASTNSLGFDSAIFQLDNPGNSIIGNNQTSATLRLDSNQETYGLYLLGFSVDVWAPELDPIQLIMTGGANPSNPGDNLEYSFSVLNRGNDDAVNVTTTTTLPPSVENVITTNLPAGVTYVFESTTGELTFDIADNLVAIGQPEFTVDFELVLQDDCYFLEENCDLSFELQFLSTYFGVENPSEQTTLSSAGLDACNLGNLEPLIIDINQPVVQWATQPGELDRTIDCDSLDTLDTAQSLEPVTDKCEFTLEKTSGDFVPSTNSCGTNNGSYTNTWTFTDACGVTIAEFVQIITIQDISAPTFNETLPTDVTVECDAIPETVTLTANDNCAGSIEVIFNEVENDATCPAIQTIVRTWTATDGCGNIATHTQTITVQDTTAPTFNETLPTDVTVECDAIPEAVTLTAEDNCTGSIEVTFDEVENDATCPTLQTIVRTWTATDDCGNIATHTQTITVQDTTAPTFNETLPTDVTVECDAIPEAVTLTANDNCAGSIEVIFNEVENDATCPAIQTIVRTWTATDDCGNIATHTQTITVQDTTAPTFNETLPTDISVECGDVPDVTTLTATDNCADAVEVTFNEVDNSTDACNQTLVRTWTVTDACGNTTTHTQTITIQDNTTPVITTEASDIAIECDGSGNNSAIEDWLNSNGGATATDNCNTVSWTNNYSGTTSDCSTPVEVIFTATDACGNSSTTSASYSIQDNNAPIIESASQSLTVECGDDIETALQDWLASNGGATGTDDCSSVSWENNFSELSNDCGATGSATVTFTATDACGNSTITSATFTVEDTTAPTFNETLPADITAECGEVPEAASLTASDNCSDATVTFNQEDNSTDACNQSLVRTWTATDACGNTTTHTQTITIQDTAAPTFNETLPTDITAECDEFEDPVTLTASDNCGSANVTFDETQVEGTCPTLLIITRTWTAVDDCNNIVTHTQTITVNDTTAPTFNEELPADITAECGEIPEAVTLTANDNCAGSISVTFNEEDNSTDACNQSLVRTWTATDTCGNTATHTQTITIQDNSAPTFNETLPADITAECGEVPEAVILTASDNCSDVTVTFNEEDTSTDACNQSVIRTWTATDACGNMSTHTQTITIQDTTAPTFNEALPGDITTDCGDIPDAVTLTANDNCSANTTVTFNEVNTSTDDCNQSLIRTWTATDDCGNTTTHTQTIAIQDTTAPTFTVPTDVNLSCEEDIDDITLTGDVTDEADNCSTDLEAIFSDEVISQDECATVISRTWTLTDDCGNTTTATQSITIADTQAPVVIGDFEQVINVDCDAIPDAPNLSFEDDCSSITVNGPVETIENVTETSYSIIRTWTVEDTCNNINVYTQTVNVTNTISQTQLTERLCIEDEETDLFSLLPNGIDATGTWEVISGDATLDGSFFDPTLVELGEYQFTYTLTDTIDCSVSYLIIMTVDDECVVLGCNDEENVIISKAVTPNGDMHNENFEITGIEFCDFTVDVQIFNRWGALIYKSNDYQNNWNGFNPKASIGASNKVPTGTYYYIVNLKGSGLKPFTGPIYVGTK